MSIDFEYSYSTNFICKVGRYLFKCRSVKILCDTLPDFLEERFMLSCPEKETMFSFPSNLNTMESFNNLAMGINSNKSLVPW